MAMDTLAHNVDPSETFTPTIAVMSAEQDTESDDEVDVENHEVDAKFIKPFSMKEWRRDILRNARRDLTQMADGFVLFLFFWFADRFWGTPIFDLPEWDHGWLFFRALFFWIGYKLACWIVQFAAALINEFCLWAGVGSEIETNGEIISAVEAIFAVHRYDMTSRTVRGFDLLQPFLAKNLQ
jgi:hypothetical protein